MRSAYERGENDEFVLPTIVGVPRPIDDGDACIFFNFRPDRARQLTIAFDAGIAAYRSTAFDAFEPRAYRDLFFATMTKYEEDYPNPVLFGPRPQYDTFGEILSRAGLRQLRLAETEKYAHVTYFFNGGREDVFAGEDRELIPSDRSVPTYDLAPAMRAREITDAAVAAISSGNVRCDRDELCQRRHGRAHRQMGTDDSKAWKSWTRACSASPMPCWTRAACSSLPPTTATPKKSSTRRASR